MAQKCIGGHLEKKAFAKKPGERRFEEGIHFGARGKFLGPFSSHWIPFIGFLFNEPRTGSDFFSGQPSDSEKLQLSRILEKVEFTKNTAVGASFIVWLFWL